MSELYLKWLGVVSLGVILVSGVTPLFFARPLDISESVSQSWARGSRRYRLMGVVLTVFGAGLCASMAGWMVPAYRLSAAMYFVLAAGYAALLAIAWVPMDEKPGEHPLWHGHFLGGAIAATGAVAGFAIIAWGGQGVPRLSHALSLAGLGYGACWPAFFLPRARRVFLVLECGLVLVFTLMMLSLTLGW